MSTELPPESRDIAAFSEHLRRGQAQIYGYLHSLLRDLNDADDVFQNVALILWRKFGEYEPSRSFVAWACGVARLEVSNFLRVRSRSRLYLGDDLNLLLIDAQAGLSHDESEARRKALAGCVEKLRERDRDLLTRCYGEGTGVAEAAERDGRSPQSVHNSLRRIRKALFECIRRTLRNDLATGVTS